MLQKKLCYPHPLFNKRMGLAPMKNNLALNPKIFHQFSAVGQQLTITDHFKTGG